MQNMTELKQTSTAAASSTITANFKTMSDATTAEIYLYVAGRTNAGITGIVPVLVSPHVSSSDWYNFGPVTADTAKGAGHYKFTFAYRLPLTTATVFEIGVKIDGKALEDKAKITLTPQDLKDATMQASKHTIDANDKDAAIVTLKLPHVKDDLGYRLYLREEPAQPIQFKRKGTDNTTYEAAYTVPIEGVQTLVAYDYSTAIVTNPKSITITATTVGHKVDPSKHLSLMNIEGDDKITDAGSVNIGIYLSDSTRNPLDGKLPVPFIVAPSGVTSPADYSFGAVKPYTSEGKGNYIFSFTHNSVLDKVMKFEIGAKVDGQTLEDKATLEVTPQDLKEVKLDIYRGDTDSHGVVHFYPNLTFPHVKDDISSRLKLQDSKGNVIKFALEGSKKDSYRAGLTIQDSEIHSLTAYYNNKVISGIPILALAMRENFTSASWSVDTHFPSKGERVEIILALPHVVALNNTDLTLVDDMADTGALGAFSAFDNGKKYSVSFSSTKVGTHKLRVKYKGKFIPGLEPLEITVGAR